MSHQRFLVGKRIDLLQRCNIIHKKSDVIQDNTGVFFQHQVFFQYFPGTVALHVQNETGYCLAGISKVFLERNV